MLYEQPSSQPYACPNPLLASRFAELRKEYASRRDELENLEGRMRVRVVWVVWVV